MFELLRVLIFGNVLTLSPGFVDIDGNEIDFTASSPLEALNAGARLSVNVSSVVAQTESLDTMRRTEEAFPRGCIKATGIQADGRTVPLESQAVAWSRSGTYVILSEQGGANVKVKFTTIKVSSCRPIPRASAEWANYGK